MASVTSKPSDEEMQKNYQNLKESYIKRQGGMPDSPVPGASQVAYQSNSDYSIGDIAPTIRHDRKGNRYIADPHGSGDYRFNERTGAWMAPGGKTLMLTEAAPASAAPDAAPIGAPPPLKADWRDNIDMTQGEGSAGSGDGLTTDQIVDNTGMNNWMAMGPQTAGQHINPLVDPANWQYQVNPQHQQVRNLGTYKNPMLDEWMSTPFSQGGLLALNTGGLLNG